MPLAPLFFVSSDLNANTRAIATVTRTFRNVRLALLAAMAASLLITRAYKTAPPAGGALSAPVVGARRADWCDATCREHLIVAKSANELVDAYKKVKREWEAANSGTFVPANVAYACGTWTLSLAKKASHGWNYYGVHKASSAREVVSEVQRWNKNLTDKNTMLYLVSATAGDGEWIYVVKGEDAKGDYGGIQCLVGVETVTRVKFWLDIWFKQGLMAEHIVYGNGGWLVVVCAAEAGSSHMVVAEDSADNLRTGIVNAYALAVQSGKNYRVAHLVGDGKRSGVAVMVSTNSTASVAEKVVITRGVSDIASHVGDG